MKKTVPYITGDGVGVEITPSMQAIVNAAVKKAYGNEHEIEWMEVLAGERAFNETGSWLPDETMEAFKKYGVGIKGPLTTPGRRWYPFLECGFAPDAGSVCVSAPRTLVQRSGISGERASEGGYAYFPRKYGRYLCRYRMGSRHAGS